jgi:hypothetical protein
MTQKGKQQPRSALSARLLELSAETNNPEPYPVTETLIVYPPTRTRRKAMNAAEMKMYLCSQLLSQAINTSSSPEPELPEDPTDEQQVEHAQWLVDRAEAQAKLAGINEQHDSAEIDYEKAFFGDSYKAVMEFFEDKPLLWDKFVPDIRAEFLPVVPDNGQCPTCGHVGDEEAAGKAPESLT